MRRVNPLDFGKDQDNYLIHLARYMFVARQLKKTSSVLEVGCGTGYGARLLADYASSVYAVDDAEDLQEMWQSFSFKGLKFDTKIPNNQFDAVVSFEVIEHIEEAEADDFLDTLKSKLVANGVVYLSTPRAISFESRSINRQKFHKREYSPIEFRQLLERHFSNVFLFGQNDAIISTQNLDMCWNLVAICV